MSSPLPPDPKRTVQLSVRWAVSTCLVVLGVAAVTFFVFSTQLAIIITLGASMVALALEHLVRLFMRRGLHRPWAIAAVIGVVLLFLTGVVLLLAPPVVSQGRALAEAAPGLVERFSASPTVQAIQERLHDAGFSALGGETSSAILPVLGAVRGAVSLVATLITVFVLSLLMLVFGPELIEQLLGVLNPARRAQWDRLLHEAYVSIGGYLTGLAAVCGINGTLTATFLALMHVPFFLPLGFLSGLLCVVPYAGPAVALVLITALTWTTVGATKALAVLVYFLVLGQLQGNVLEPVVYKHAIHTNPLVITLAVLFLAEFKGIPGAILAVPAVAVLQVALGDWLDTRRAAG